jgi:DNA adenine methylase
MKQQRVIEMFVCDADEFPADMNSKELPLLYASKPSEIQQDSATLPEVPERYRQLQVWPHSNVSSVPLLSPFRYPGGKTWLVPILKYWMARLQPLSEFIEPFAGGAIVGLTAAFNNFSDHVTLVELDDAVAAVWETILRGNATALADRIASFNINDVDDVLDGPDNTLTTEELAFRTILRNRINRGGILAQGAGRLRRGENGRGLQSRWYPNTLQRRILQIASIRERISFSHGDGLSLLASSANRLDAAYFIDPPYMSPAKGKRLYKVHDVDHEHLFWTASKLKGSFLMTYEDSQSARDLTRHYKLEMRVVIMKNTFHMLKRELLIGRDFVNWLPSAAVSDTASLLSFTPD